jgi:FixJ family two-component response regulator
MWWMTICQREGVAGRFVPRTNGENVRAGEEFLAAPGKVPSCLVLISTFRGQRTRPATGACQIARKSHRLLTGHGDIPMTVRAVKAGAVTLTKPAAMKTC